MECVAQLRHPPRADLRGPLGLDLGDDLRDIVGSRRLAPGQRLRDALMDVLVHGQDIAVPLGRCRAMPLEAGRASAEHLWWIGFPFHARKRLRGFRLVATDVDWAVGDGAEIRGPIAGILPLLAGRTAVLARLAGDGATSLAAKHATVTDSGMPGS